MWSKKRQELGQVHGELCEQLDFINSYVYHMGNLDKGISLVPKMSSINVYISLIGVRRGDLAVGFPVSLFGGMIASAGETSREHAGVQTRVEYSDRSLQIRGTGAYKGGHTYGVINFIPGSGAEIGDLIVETPLSDSSTSRDRRKSGAASMQKASKVQPGQKWLKRVVAEMGRKS